MNRQSPGLLKKSSTRPLETTIAKSLDALLPPAKANGPLGRLQSRSMALLLLLVCTTLTAQLLNSLVFKAPDILIIMGLVGLIAMGFLWLTLRAGQSKESLCALTLLMIPGVIACLEIWTGRSPITPFVIWYPLLVFLGVTIAGSRRGLVVSGLIILLSLMHLSYTFNMDDRLHLSGGASLLAHIRRLEGAILLMALVTTLLIQFYLHFFHHTLDELDRLEAGKSHRKRLSTLAVFGSSAARELERPLSAIEAIIKDLPSAHSDKKASHLFRKIEAIRDEIGSMATITQHYLLLSSNSKGKDSDVSASQLLDFTSMHYKSFIKDHGQALIVNSSEAEHMRLAAPDGHLGVLILCSAIRRIVEAKDARILSLTANASHQTAVFTLRYNADHTDGFEREMQELHEEFFLTLKEAGGRLTLSSPTQTLILQLPIRLL